MRMRAIAPRVCCGERLQVAHAVNGDGDAAFSVGLRRTVEFRADTTRCASLYRVDDGLSHRRLSVVPPLAILRQRYPYPWSDRTAPKFRNSV